MSLDLQTINTCAIDGEGGAVQNWMLHYYTCYGLHVDLDLTNGTHIGRLLGVKIGFDCWVSKLVRLTNRDSYSYSTVKICAHSTMSVLGVCHPLARGPGARQSSPMAVEEGNLLGCDVVFLCQEDGTDDGALLLHVELESAR